MMHMTHVTASQQHKKNLCGESSVLGKHFAHRSMNGSAVGVRDEFPKFR